MARNGTENVSISRTKWLPKIQNSALTLTPLIEV